jgi:nitrate reductase gamma subunit
MRILLFIILPYAAFTLAIFASLYRYFTNRFSYSSLSSQLIENRQLYWGAVPWHYGIILILLAHLWAALFPASMAALLSGRIRLVVLETAGLSLGLFTLFGWSVLVLRRLRVRSLQRLTTPMDWILLGLLGIQVLSGVGMAMFARWGALWYLDTAVPWLRSIFSLQPDASTVVPLSGFIKLHMINGVILILLLPFTRLVHLLSVPVSYLWRPYQLVIWNSRPQGQQSQDKPSL